MRGHRHASLAFTPDAVIGVPVEHKPGTGKNRLDFPYLHERQLGPCVRLLDEQFRSQCYSVNPICRAMTNFRISLVPSPIVRILASR